MQEAALRVEDVASTLLDPNSRNDQAKLKVLCLRRDGYRCMVAGIYDAQQPE